MIRMQNIQYTLRKVPSDIDACIRQRAHAEDKSINEIAIEAMRDGLHLGGVRPKYDDLDDLAGTWVSDPMCEQALEEMDRIDPEMWK